MQAYYINMWYNHAIQTCSSIMEAKLKQQNEKNKSLYETLFKNTQNR